MSGFINTAYTANPVNILDNVSTTFTLYVYTYYPLHINIVLLLTLFINTLLHCIYTNALNMY